VELLSVTGVTTENSSEGSTSLGFFPLPEDGSTQSYIKRYMMDKVPRKKLHIIYLNIPFTAWTRTNFPSVRISKNLVMDIVLLSDLRRVMAWSTAGRSPTVKQCLLAFMNFVFHLNYNIACSSFNMTYIQ